MARKKIKNAAAQELGRRGGIIRSKLLTQEQRSAIARLGGLAMQRNKRAAVQTQADRPAPIPVV